MLDQIRRAGDLNQITQAQALAVVDQRKFEGCPKNKGYQIWILAAKHATFAKHATVTIHAPLFRLFMYYTINVRCQYWENSCSFGLRYVSWYKYLTVSLVFSHLGFWSGNLFLIAPFPDLCLLVPFPTHRTTPNWIVSNSLDSVDAQGKVKSSSITKLYRKPWDAFAREIGMTLPKLYSSRNRGMNVSEHRESGATLDERAHLATAMSHEARTAEHYARAYPVLDRLSAEQTDSMRELRKQVGAGQLQQSHLASVMERLQSPSQPPYSDESGSSGTVAPTPLHLRSGRAVFR